MVRALLGGRKTQTRRLAENRNAAQIQPGDRLWVRETWNVSTAYDDLSPSEMSGEEDVVYRVDGATQPMRPTGRTRSPIYMPRWASRLTLIVREVRFDFLDAITPADAIAEGAQKSRVSCGNKMIDGWGMGDARFSASPRGAFFAYWDRLNPKRPANDGPKVSVITFDVVRRNIDQIGGGQ